MKTLTNKNILLGVSGSIAAYKAPDIVRRLQDLGADVKVVLTSGGERFITKLSLEVVSKNPVATELWDSNIEHIELAKWADLILIAPASAGIIAKIVSGRVDGLLENIILASNCPLMISPAMNKQMLDNKATIENIKNLKKRGVGIISSAVGKQACGDFGAGRMREPVQIANEVAKSFQSTKLTAKKMLITLGATIEAIDPVRYISNHSSGKMGAALANSCIEAGAKVTCIYGDITTSLPNKANNIHALSADDMHKAVMDNINEQDVFICVAAVSDFKVKNIAKNKIKKSDKNLTIELIKNKDILADVCKLKSKPVCIGFAAETTNFVKNAQNKLKNKGCDAIILNDVSKPDFGFKNDENEVLFLSEKLELKINKNSKQKIANKIIDIVSKEFI